MIIFYSFDIWSCKWIFGSRSWQFDFHNNVQHDDNSFLCLKEIRKLGFQIEELPDICSFRFHFIIRKDTIWSKEINDIDVCIWCTYTIYDESNLPRVVPFDA